MVDLSNVTPLQKERFLKLMEIYSANNKLDYSIFKDNELKQRCLSIQIDVIENKIDLLPDRSASLSYLGSLYNMKGRASKAIGYYTEALRIDPYSAVTHNNMAIALTKMGRLDEAIRHFSEALRINPEYTKAHNDLGVALAKQGRLDEAISHYSEALRTNPGYAEAHNNLGIALARKGKIEDAVAHFREALRIRPDFVGAHNNLKKALRLQRK
jgi:tetratricopeptide (TPR) repeat protein